MATELLVDKRLDDGSRLAAELVRSGFDVAAAFWIHTEEDGLWFLYLASSSVARDGLGSAVRNVYATLSRLQLPGIELSQIKLVAPTDPIAVDAIANRDRYRAPILTRLGAGQLGNVAIEEAYLYPPIGPAPTRAEVLEAVAARIGRIGAGPISLTLRDGSMLHGTPVGIEASPSGNDVTVRLRDDVTGQAHDISAGEILLIR